MEEPQYSERIVKFTGVKFGTVDLRTEIAYKQILLRVFVDSQEPEAYPVIEKTKPETTPGSDGEERHSSSTKSGWTRVMTAMLSLGLNTHGSLSGGLTKTNERVEGSEMTRYTSPITQQDIDGKIWWDYGIGDDRYQEKGYTIPEAILPTVHFGFDNISPPKRNDIVITSYWSKISPTRNEPNRTQIHKLLHLFKAIGKTQRISFSNLFQIVALTANMDNLMKRNHYKAKVKMYLDSGISELPKPEEQQPEAEFLKGIEGTSVVVDADRKYIIFRLADLDLTKPIFTGLEKLKLESFPTTRNAEFKISDIYDSDWVEIYKSKFQ